MMANRSTRGPLFGSLTPQTQARPEASTNGSVLDIEKDYNMLSLRDLVAARDLYHLHLMDRQHVVATAVGRYLIRKSEPWPQGKGQASAHDSAMAKRAHKEPRTLANSEVRPYSWPCVLVFVDEWVDLGDVGAELDPGDLVPRTLLLRARRAVRGLLPFRVQQFYEGMVS